MVYLNKVNTLTLRKSSRYINATNLKNNLRFTRSLLVTVKRSIDNYDIMSLDPLYSSMLWMAKKIRDKQLSAFSTSYCLKTLYKLWNNWLKTFDDPINYVSFCI